MKGFSSSHPPFQTFAWRYAFGLGTTAYNSRLRSSRLIADILPNPDRHTRTPLRPVPQQRPKRLRRPRPRRHLPDERLAPTTPSFRLAPHRRQRALSESNTQACHCLWPRRPQPDRPRPLKASQKPSPVIKLPAGDRHSGALRNIRSEPSPDAPKRPTNVVWPSGPLSAAPFRPGTTTPRNVSLAAFRSRPAPPYGATSCPTFTRSIP